MSDSGNTTTTTVDEVSVEIPPPASQTEKTCKVCQSPDIEFTSDPCECFVTCKKCAMKMATGGKCKKCDSYYTSMKRIH